MNQSPLALVWLIAADLLTMLSFILAVYIFVLNPRRRNNRYVSVALVVLAINILCISFLLRANTYQQAGVYLAILAGVGPAIGPALTIASIMLIKPSWLSGRRVWLLVVLVGLAVLPVLLTLVDVVLKTHFYYTPPGLLTYTGGYPGYQVLVNGLIGQPVIYIVLVGLSSILILPLAFFAFFDRSLSPITRNLARLLLGAQILSAVLNFALTDRMPSGYPSLLVAVVYVLAYGYAGFQQMISGRATEKFNLRTRLTVLTLIISIPAFIFITITLSNFAKELLDKSAVSSLRDNNYYLSLDITNRLDNNVLALKNLAAQLAIISMDPIQQKPVLQVMAAYYLDIYLISTTDTRGINVARSDDGQLTDYSDSLWFQKAISGAPVTYQDLIERTNGQPALVISVPIRDTQGNTVGVCMIASYLSSLSQRVNSVSIGKTGYSYVVDETNQLIASPIIRPGSKELLDFSQDPAVVAMRSGRTPPLSLVDSKGIAWRAYYSTLDNGWGVVIVQRESEISQPYQTMQRLGVIFILIGSLVLFALIWATMRQAIRPINDLTQAVRAIAAGDLERAAPVEGQDEVATLALAFNSMTSQLRNLIDSLERRVAERTLDLEHRSAQLTAAAEVGRASATIRNLDELLPLVTRLIGERFGFYHVGIFLLDEYREFAVLRASNSPGGQRMLARGHKLRIGEQGIVGYVAAHQEPRVVLNVGDDTAYFNNLDLIETQSEMALPLEVGDQLLGVLDVQSSQPNAYTEQDVETLRVLADQVAIAINSAHLVQQTEELLKAERHAYGEVSRQAWVENIKSLTNLGFSRSRGTGLTPIREIKDPAVRRVLESGQTSVDPDEPVVLYAPVKVRNRVIGALKLRASEKIGVWDQENIRMVENMVVQLGIALESARSYQQTQLTAQRERMLGDITARVRETLDIETILKTASQEVRLALGLPRVVVRLGAPEHTDEHDANERKSSVGGSDA